MYILDSKVQHTHHKENTILMKGRTENTQH